MMFRSSNAAIVRILALSSAFAVAPSASAIPPDEVVEEQLNCWAELSGVSFQANPSTVQPFSSTTLSWSVPSGCNGQIQVDGRNVSRQGSLQVTPNHASTTYQLVARSIGGARNFLASRTVTVNQATCSTTTIDGWLIIPLITNVLDEMDAADDDFYQTDSPDIVLSPAGLNITLHLGVDSWYFDPSVDLEMNFVFTVNDGLVSPSYTYFHPVADTSLPDDWVTSEFYDRANGILADFRTNINEQLPAFVPQNKKLFDLRPTTDALLATICDSGFVLPTMDWGNLPVLTLDPTPAPTTTPPKAVLTPIKSVSSKLK
jgi:hypothetical protein